MRLKRQRSIFIIKTASAFANAAESVLCDSLSMKVKIVQWSERHVMGVLSLSTLERTPKTAANAMKARGLKEKICSELYITTSEVTLFEKIHVEDVRNHSHHRRRDTLRLTMNEVALESA